MKILRSIPVIAIAILMASCVPKPLEQRRPHIVIISMDTVRADYLGCYGNESIPTPHLDAIADRAIMFDRMFTPAVTTLSAHTSILTGTHPHRHGVGRNGMRVNGDNELLPELLKPAGYTTAAFVSAFPLSPDFDFHQGFDVFNDEFGTDEPGGARSGDMTNAAVAEYLDACEGEAPMFLFVHYWDAHYPYQPSEEALARVADIKEEMPADAEMDATRAAYLAGEQGVTPEALRKRYAAEITEVDEHVGALIAMLEDHGILEDAIVVVTSDHGESVWDNEPYFDHGFDTYQSSAHTVGMVMMPQGAYAGTRIDTAVSTVDWAPSILAYTGLPTPDRVEGRDLKLVEGAKDLRSEPVFIEATRPHSFSDEFPWMNMALPNAVVEWPFKYVVNRATNERELYDLSTDPNEKMNLLDNDANHPKVKSLDRLIVRWRENADPYSSKDITTMNPEVKERLETMGYF